jgi:formamidopyrimidine-DNA glycosylase
VYRAEILFLAGISPHRRAKDLTEDERRQVWDLTREQLRLGERAGRIVTVDPADVGAKRRSDLDRHTRLYVYKRQGDQCRRCDEPIQLGELGNRKVWWCPNCQPR